MQKNSHIGDEFLGKSRCYYADPKLISIGNNVFVTVDMTFVNHDTIRTCSIESMVPISSNALLDILKLETM